jgi:PST family polysaccharide transporter
MSDTNDNLGARTATGMVWMTSQTVISRATSLLAQLALAWLLAPEHFGRIGLVYTIVGFAAQLTNPGIDDVLIQKQKRVHRWVTPAFWLSLTCGTLGATVMVLAATVVVHVARHYHNEAYGSWQLLWMVVILASAAPFNALGLVPMVLLRRQLRFARVAGINFGELMLLQGLTVLLAAMGFGAYSFVIPMPIVAAVRTAVLWRAARPQVRLQPNIHRWPALLSSTGWVFGQRIFISGINQGDYMVLGVLLADNTVVGLYFFAYVLSTQIMRVLGDNVSAVMLPALTAIHDDPPRMSQAALRACRGIAAMVAPVATLQILLAGPGIRLLLAPKWEPLIPLVQLLSFGPLLSSPTWPLNSMITAAGRFRAGFYMWLVQAIGFFALVVPFAWFWSATGTAAAVSLWAWFSLVCFAITAFQSLDGLRIVGGTLVRPLAASVVAAVPGAAVVWLMPAGTLGDLLAIALAAPLTAAAYYAALRQLDPDAVRMLTEYFGRFARPRRFGSADSLPAT